MRKSRVEKFKNLNKVSIGIELVNKRSPKYGYQNFSGDQIKNLIKLCKKFKKKVSYKKREIFGHSILAPLRKIDPGEKFPWKKLSNYKLGNWYLNKKAQVEYWH